MACSMAFFWADEPSPFRVPVAQSALAAALVAPPLVLGEVLALLLEPQPARASVPTRATPVTLASRLRDWIFTILEPLHSRENSGVLGARRDEDIEAG